MTLNGAMAVTLRYFTKFGKPAFQHITASICGGIRAQHECMVFCSACTMSSLRKFTFAISSPDEFLVIHKLLENPVTCRCKSTSIVLCPCSVLNLLFFCFLYILM